MNEVKKTHFNKPQLKVLTVKAHKTLVLFGRGTGKSTGVIAPYTLDCASTMRRSLGAFGTTTYVDMLLKILPAVERGWEKLGFVREQHYTVRQFSPKWKRPYRCPEIPTYFIHTIYGSGIQLISGDRPELSAGNDFDWLVLDEIKHMKEENVKEILPTLRGNREFFGKNSRHHSWLFCTDLWDNPAANWLFRYEELAKNPENKKKILKIGYLNNHYVQMYQIAYTSQNPDEVKFAKEQMEIAENELYKLRKKTIQFVEATSFDNIDVLGVDVLRNWKESLSPENYARHVLNMRLKRAEIGFYGALNPSIHYYERKPNYTHIDRISQPDYEEMQTDSRWWSDIDPNQPLHIACDYNSAINTVVVAQIVDNELRIIDHQFVKHPKGIDHLIAQFNKFYKHHKCKVIHYYYDSTATNQDYRNKERASDIWIGGLQAKGWTVLPSFLGAATEHEDRYWFTSEILLGKKHYHLRINSRLEDFTDSLEMTGVIRGGGKKFQKDKSSEKSKLIPPEKATHAGEALDTMLEGILRKGRIW